MHELSFLEAIFPALHGPVRKIVFAALVCSMKKAAVLLNALFVFLSLGHAQTPAATLPSPQDPAPTKIMKVDDVRPGMKGVGYTVFEGTKPETMGVEVLGVLRNLNGPKSDVVLVRLLGNKAEFTGVVAGMSGSPVYIDGKLLGAIAYRIGQFSKEPIAGVTPIEQMLEINEFDQSVPQGAGTSVARATVASKTSTPGVQDSNPIQSYAQYLQPIDAPFVFNGFNEAAIRQFAPQLSAMGITPDVEDRVTPPPSTPLHDGSTVTFDRVSVVTRAVSRPLPYEARTEWTNELAPGRIVVAQPGIAGLVRTIERVTFVDGKAVARRRVGETVLRPAVDELRLSGPLPASLPQEAPGGHAASGLATWYDPPWSGFTAASPWIPFGTRVTVRDLSTGRTVIVTIDDRGPFGPGRIIDLSPEAFSSLAPLGHGIIDVGITW